MARRVGESMPVVSISSAASLATTDWNAMTCTREPVSGSWLNADTMMPTKPWSRAW